MTGTDSARKTLGAHPDPHGGDRPPLPWRVVRRCIREFLWIFVVILDLGRRFGAVLLRTEYTLGGTCKQRGACCHHILLEWSPAFDRFPWLARLILFKHTRIHSFFDRGYTWEMGDGIYGRVLGCRSLQDDGTCGEYRIRPAICRAYPHIPLTGKPNLLKGCGFRFDRRDGRVEVKRAEPLVQLPQRLGPSQTTEGPSITPER